MKSTVPVGTGEKVRAGLDDRGLEHVGYASNPEFLAEGRAVHDFMNPDRIVVGSFSPADGDAVANLYAGIDGPVVRADVNSAEMIKLAANAFLMTRISFINEIANVCEATGADVVKVAEGVGLDNRLGPHFLRAGIGYGGSCFPKDSLALKQLARTPGYHFQLLSAVIEVNELQKRRVVGKLKGHLGSLRGKTVALLGLAFKAGTDDMREAPSIVLASRLLAEGADVRAWDPVADGGKLPTGVNVVGSVLEAVSGADAAVIVTEWPELKDLASTEVRDAMANPLIIDGRNLLDPETTRRAGFEYEGIGRPVLERCAARDARARPDHLGGSDHPRRRAGRAPRRCRGRPSEGARRDRRQAARGVPGHPARARRGHARDRVVRRGPGRPLRAGARSARRRDRGGGGTGASRPRRRDQVRCACEDERRRRLRAERRRARRRRLHGAAREASRGGGLATITVAQPKSPFGLVDVDDDDVVRGFREDARVPYWVNCGNYVLSAAAIERFPDRGDHESTTFPELAAEGSCTPTVTRGCG